MHRMLYICTHVTTLGVKGIMLNTPQEYQTLAVQSITVISALLVAVGRSYP